MHHPTTWFHACQLAKEAKIILQAQPMKALVLTHPHLEAHPAPTQTLKVQKVSQVEMVERCKKGLCYYCDEKYSPGHKCREQKFFQIDASASSPSEDIP
jgi:histone acetyltransferase (RNA polymerase elongator complex component)